MANLLRSPHQPPGSLPLSYQWRFAGTDISNATDSSFTILSVSTNDAGIYSVIVANAVGSVVSSNAVLTVSISGDFTYTTNGNTITITKYTGAGGAVTIPNSINGIPVISIGTYAFWSCPGLTNVTIPSSVISIETKAFVGYASLTAITVDPLNSFYSSVDGVLFNKSQTTLIQCPGGKAGSYTIPSSVTAIGTFTFHYCTSLTSVTIPTASRTSGPLPSIAAPA